jgi:hypothetical protein
MAGVNMGTKETRRNIRDACVYGGFQTTDKLYFRDTEIYIQSDADGYINIVADTGVKLNGVIFTGLDGAFSVAYTIAAENVTAGTKAVAVQINKKDASTAVGVACMVTQYFSSDAAGQTMAAAPSGGVAAGTDGTIAIELTADVIWLAITEADGDIDLTLTDTTADTWYLNTVTADGVIHTSGKLIFT